MTSTFSGSGSHTITDPVTPTPRVWSDHPGGLERKTRSVTTNRRADRSRPEAIGGQYKKPIGSGSDENSQ